MIPRQTKTGKLPARLGRIEIAVARPDVATRRDARATTQDVLAAHELAVVLANCPFSGSETGVRSIVVPRPFPDITEGLRKDARGRRATRSHLPFGFGRQTRLGPACKGLGLKEAHMTDGRVGVNGHLPMQREGVKIAMGHGMGCDLKRLSQTRWRGISLSKQKSGPLWPISCKPASNVSHRRSQARIGVSGHGFWYAGFKG